MNKLVKVLSLTAIIAFTGFQAFSQAKFAHINSNELLSVMPEIKQADKKLQDYGTQLDAQLRTMTGEYQNKVSEFQNKEALMADAVKKAKIQEIGDLENRISEFQQTAQQSIVTKREELYAPVLDKAQTAIQEIAKEKGYSYVFDTSTGTILFAQDSDNILPLVKTKMGLK